MTGRNWSRRGTLASAAGLLWSGVAWAQTAAPESPADPTAPESLKSVVDQARRLTTEVFVNGRGPYLFLVDTGADHSVISRELANEIGLPPGPSVMVHGVAGDITAPSALVEEFRVGSRGLTNVALPLLEQANIGAAGVLGIDAVRDQRVVLDFRSNRILVSDSPPQRPAADEVVVKGHSRFGQLVLVDSTLDDRSILVIIDTGAESSIANSAFRRRISITDFEQAGEITAIYSVTGQSTTGKWAVIPAIQVGGFRMKHLAVVFSDLRSFERWRVHDQPTLLLGMDILRFFDMVEIDFARREVRFGGLRAEEGPLHAPFHVANAPLLPPHA